MSDRVSHSINRTLDLLGWWSACVGAVALVLIMLVIVVDITIRAAFSKAIYGNIEMIGLLLIFVFFAGYAYAERTGLHIKVDVLVGRLPPTTQQIITLNGYLISTGTMTIVCWQFLSHAWFLKNSHIVTGLLDIPTWPFVVTAAIFIAIFVLTLLASFCTHLNELLRVRRIRICWWLLPGIIVGTGLLVFSLWPHLLPFRTPPSTWGVIILGALFVAIFLRVHIACAMALMALVGLSYISGAEASLANLGMSAIGVANTYTWSVAPLFMWMGLLAYYGGFAKELYTTAYKWIGHLPGGLASATTAACAGLAAITGGTMTGVLCMGTIALPEMKKYKYDDKLATATICTASTIGALIPPSLAFIIYGMVTQVSIGRLFIAGIFPGILFTIILITMITIMCRRNPKLGPPGPKFSWKERVISIKDVWAVALLIVVVIGGIYMGIFTPTEAGAIGAFGAIVISLVRRRLGIKGLAESAGATVRMMGIVFFIFVFAIAFSYFLSLTNLPRDLAEWIVGLGLAPYVVIVVILFIYMILGCLMNSLPAVIITLPVFFPIAMAAGFDPVWFGVLIVVMVELGQITPPIGMNVFAMSAIATDIPMYDIFKGVLPFWGAFIVLTIILVAFPQVSLFLPDMMFG